MHHQVRTRGEPGAKEDADGEVGGLDESASNPHGGTNGSKILDSKTLGLIDVGRVDSRC